MLVIRLKTVPNKIVRYGEVTPNEDNPYPLGEFNTTLYEQVELEDFPLGLEIIRDRTSSDILRDLALVVQTQPLELRLQFASVRSIISHLVTMEDYDCAKALINTLPISDELKSEVLECF